MAKEDSKVKVKNTNIQQIFHSMNYGEVVENTNLATTWLKDDKNNTIHAYIDSLDKGSKGKAVQVCNVYNGDLLATVHSPIAEDVNIIISQSVGNHKWLLTEEIAKAVLLEKLASEIEKNSSLLSQLEILARGIFSVDSQTKAIPLLIAYLRYYSSWALTLDNKKWKPPGLAFSIVSDKSFLSVFGFVLGPALAAGYNVILQTEPRISLLAKLIVELAAKVGFPEGAIILLPGTVNLGPIFKHPDIAVISSFGDVYAENFEKPFDKKYLAITNGKAPMIVFNSADLDSACEAVIDSVWSYQGLLPWSVNTVYVQEDVFQTFVDKLKHRMSKVKMDCATNKMADVSYPINLARSDSAASDPPIKQLEVYVQEARRRGIDVFRSYEDFAAFQPTLLVGGKIDNDTSLPVLSVLAFRTSNEAVSLTNCKYGMGAFVWTEHIGLANEMAKKLNVSNVWINSCNAIFAADVCFAIRKQSGTGYFGGKEGFIEYVGSRTAFKTSKTAIRGGSGNDLLKCIVAAQKSQAAWNNMARSIRSKTLRKVASELITKTKFLREYLGVEESFLKNWILAIYETSARIDDLGQHASSQNYELRTFQEPVGLVAIDDDVSDKLTVNLIIGALILGNAVTILNWSSEFVKFLTEILKIFSNCGVPSGVFNVCFNCGKDVYDTFLRQKELNVLFTKTNVNSHENCNDFKRIYSVNLEWFDILTCTTTVKNVWSNTGDSVL